MAITLTELKEKLKTLDEIVLCEVLDITSEELVERFDDIVEEKYDELVEEFEEQEE